MEELTRLIPKALLRMGNLTILEIVLQRLRNAGIRRVVINSHYKSDRVREFLKEHEHSGLEVLLSEEEKILGTGGGIAYARRFFQDETILAINADVLTNLSVKKFIDYFQEAQPLASMAIIPSVNNRDYSLVMFDDDGLLKGFLPKNKDIPAGGQTGIFTGYQILSSKALDYLQPVYSSVIESFYRPALQNGEIIGVFGHRGQWIDVGTKSQYLETAGKFENGILKIEDFR